MSPIRQTLSSRKKWWQPEGHYPVAEPAGAVRITSGGDPLRSNSNRFRRKILDLNMEEIPVADDVDLDSVARRLEGYSGADIAYLCRKVAETVFEKAIGKDHEPPIRNADFEEVLAKFRPSVSRVDIDRYRSFQAEGS